MPWAQDEWNIPRIQKWARRAPLVGTFAVDKTQDAEIFVVSLDVRGAHGKIIHHRSSCTTLRRALDTQQAREMLRRQFRYMSRKMIQRVRRECGRPIHIAENPFV